MLIEELVIGVRVLNVGNNIYMQKLEFKIIKDMEKDGRKIIRFGLFCFVIVFLFYVIM